MRIRGWKLESGPIYSPMLKWTLSGDANVARLRGLAQQASQGAISPRGSSESSTIALAQLGALQLAWVRYLDRVQNAGDLMPEDRRRRLFVCRPHGARWAWATGGREDKADWECRSRICPWCQLRRADKLLKYMQAADEPWRLANVAVPAIVPQDEMTTEKLVKMTGATEKLSRRASRLAGDDWIRTLAIMPTQKKIGDSWQLQWAVSRALIHHGDPVKLKDQETVNMHGCKVELAVTQKRRLNLRRLASFAEGPRIGLLFAAAEIGVWYETAMRDRKSTTGTQLERVTMDAEQLYELLRRTAEEHDVFITDHADDLLGQACSAMRFGDDAEAAESDEDADDDA
jgi:hypothetical protein